MRFHRWWTRARTSCTRSSALCRSPVSRYAKRSNAGPRLTTKSSKESSTRVPSYWSRLVHARGGPVCYLRAAGKDQEMADWIRSVMDALGPFGVGVLIALETVIPPIPSELVLPLAGFQAREGAMNVIL